MMGPGQDNLNPRFVGDPKCMKATLRGLFPVLLSVLFLALLSLQGQAASVVGPIGASLTSSPSSLQKSILASVAAGQTKVTVSPGTYTVKVPSGQDHVVHLANVSNLEIVLTGVTLISGPQAPFFFFENCSNVTVTGGTFRHDTVPFSQGTVTAVSTAKGTVDVQIAAGYPTTLTNASYFPSNGWFNVFSAATRNWKAGIGDVWYSGIKSLSGGKFRFTVTSGLDGLVPLQVGDLVALRGTVNDDCYLYGCGGMKINGAVFQSSCGFAVHELTGAGGNRYTFALQRGPAPSGASDLPLFASNADGFHSEGVAKGPTLTNCSIAYCDDDAIAIGGGHGVVLASGGTLTFAALGASYCAAGDVLHLYDAEEGLLGDATVTLVSCSASSGGLPLPSNFDAYAGASDLTFFTVTLDKSVGNVGYVANASRQGAGFLVQGCTVLNNRERGLLIKASNGTIQNNTITGSTVSGIALVPEMQDWVEADYSRNVTISGNTIAGVGIWQDPGEWIAGALTIAEFDTATGVYVPLPGGHRSVTVSGNTFTGNLGANVVVSSAQNVSFLNNCFVNPMPAATTRGYWPGVDYTALYWITESTGVTISGNVVSNPGTAMKHVVTATATAQVVSQ